MRTDATKVGQCILDLQGKLYDLQQENERLRKESETEYASHSEKDIVECCIWLMESVYENMLEYMDTEDIPALRYNYAEIVGMLLLSRTRHGGFTSTLEKCRRLGFDGHGEVVLEGSGE